MFLLKGQVGQEGHVRVNLSDFHLDFKIPEIV